VFPCLRFKSISSKTSSASAISSYSHKDIPWLASKEGEEINYELAFYREAPYSVRNYGDEIEAQ
jgi:hypothetical protein